MNNKLETDNLQITGSCGSYCEEVVICMNMHDLEILCNAAEFWQQAYCHSKLSKSTPYTKQVETQRSDQLLSPTSTNN